MNYPVWIYCGFTKTKADLKQASGRHRKKILNLDRVRSLLVLVGTWLFSLDRFEINVKFFVLVDLQD